MTEFSTEFGTCQQMSSTEGKKFQLICSQHIARFTLSKKYYSFWERREKKINIFEGHVSWLGHVSLFSPQRELKFLLNTVIHLPDIVGCVWRTLAKKIEIFRYCCRKNTQIRHA